VLPRRDADDGDTAPLAFAATAVVRPSALLGPQNCKCPFDIIICRCLVLNFADEKPRNHTPALSARAPGEKAACCSSRTWAIWSTRRPHGVDLSQRSRVPPAEVDVLQVLPQVSMNEIQDAGEAADHAP